MMNVCKKCGVELGINMNYCPLRAQTILLCEEPLSPEETYDFQVLPMSRKEEHWDLSLIVLLAGILTSAVIDLIINKNITWSKYTIAVGLAVAIHLPYCIPAYQDSSLLIFGFTTSSC